MTNGMDAERVRGVFGEAQAAVADTQAQFAGFSLKLLDIAFARLGETVERIEDTHGHLAVQTADVRASALRPDDFFHA